MKILGIDIGNGPNVLIPTYVDGVINIPWLFIVATILLLACVV